MNLSGVNVVALRATLVLMFEHSGLFSLQHRRVWRRDIRSSSYFHLRVSSTHALDTRKKISIQYSTTLQTTMLVSGSYRL